MMYELQDVSMEELEAQEVSMEEAAALEVIDLPERELMQELNIGVQVCVNIVGGTCTFNQGGGGG